MSDMTDTEHQTVQHQLMTFYGVIKDMPLEDFIDRINECETLAPLLDPTAYIQGADRMEAIKKLAQGALVFQEAGKLLDKALNERKS